MDFKELTRQAISQVEPPNGYQLAKRMKVKPETVYRWMRGERTSRGAHAVSLMQFVGKLGVVAFLTIAALLSTTGDVSAARLSAAQDGCDRDLTVLYIMRNVVRILKTTFARMLASMACRPDPA